VTNEETRKLGFWGAVLAVILFAMVSAGLYSIATSDAIKNLLLGIIGALIASVAFAFFTNFSDSPETRLSKQMASNLEKIESLEKSLRDRELNGVLSVTDKYLHQHRFWFGILERTEKRLDIMGNSLAGWTGTNYRQQLKFHVLRICSEGGKVRFIFMDPSSDVAKTKSAIFGRNYNDLITDFVSFLNDLHKEVEEKQMGNQLEIFLSKVNLSYMLIATDSELYVSPYFSAKKSAHPLVVQLDRLSSFGEGYLEDLDRIISSSDKIT
jgi:hypothetical protein